MKVKKVEVHSIWTRARTCIGVNRYRLYVAKADYDRLLKQHKELLSKVGETK